MTPTSTTTVAPLEGKVALVTGASRGIGRAIALRLAAMGAQMLLLGRDRKALDSAAAEILASGGTARAIACDLTDEAAVAPLNTQLEPRQSCDILVNAAGIGNMGKPLHEMSVADFDAVMATNIRAPFLLMKAVVPGMVARGGGVIVNISSLAGQGPLPRGAAYAASKWGLNGLSYSVAEELREHNIRVSVVAPGSVNTGFGGSGKDRGKMLQPADVAEVVALLVTQPPQSFISEVKMRPTQKP